MNNTFEKLQNFYYSKIDQVMNTSEKDLAFKLIYPILTNFLGFKEEWLKFEDRLDYSRKITDIIVNDKRGNQVIIELKKASVNLSNNHLEQLTNYLNTQNVSWGILTNGTEWILVNNDITNAKHFEKQVLRVRLDIKNQGELHPDSLKYFTYGSLFENGGITNYLKDIQQFKMYQYTGNDQSWNQYKTNLKKLAEFLIIKRNIYISPEKITKFDLLDFFRWFATTQSNSLKSKNSQKYKIKKKTLENLYRYFRSFCQKLYENRILHTNPFVDIKLGDLIEELNDIIDDDNEDNFEITAEVIRKIYDKLDEKRTPVREKLIFSLILLGVDRKELSNLTLKHFDGKHLTIPSSKGLRKIPLPEGIIKQITAYMEYRKEHRIKSEWLICKSTGTQLKEASISWVINNTIEELELPLSIERLQQFGIKQYVINTKDILSLVYLTGMDFTRFNNILSWEEICSLVKKDTKQLYKKHPFIEFLE